MVTTVIDQREPPADEPIGTLGEHGNVFGPALVPAPGELVDLIAGRRSEKLGKPSVAVDGLQKMDAQVGSVNSQPAGLVRLGQPHAVARRIDTALAVEADEA